MRFEDEKVEFKETFVPDIYKEVIAFANTGGGLILVGVDDNGDTVGLKDLDDTYTRVYVRQGASSAPASQEQIRQMIKYADGDVFERLRTLNQELTFKYAVAVFEKRGLQFKEEKYYQLGIKNFELGLFTNLGLLLSDQCTHTVKVAVFSDDANTVFKDKKEFSGSLLEQLEEIYKYLQLCNQNRATIVGLEREEHWDYEETAVREALLNALIHRDYNYSGSIIININSREMEFISIGGLLPGITAEDIQNGISLSRNSKLSEVFHRLRFIESYGTGIRRIYTLYKDYKKQPEISITPNSFKITLPNMNAEGKVTSSVSDTTLLVEKPNMFTPTRQMKTVVDYISDYGDISLEDVQSLLGVKNTRAYVIMKKLVDAGLVEKVGRGKSKKYINKE